RERHDAERGERRRGGLAGDDDGLPRAGDGGGGERLRGREHGEGPGEQDAEHGAHPLARGRHAPPTCRMAFATATAFSGAVALFQLSAHSSSGTESATRPPPACTRATPSVITAVRIAIARSRSPAKSK